MAYSQLAQSAEEELVRQREYAQLVERVRGLAESAVPEGSTIAVVSKGDADLLRIQGRVAHHFPRNSTGAYAGHHPADDAEAISRLEAARGEGARFLLLPATSLWWLDHYSGLANHLEKRYRRVADQPDTAIIFSLEGGAFAIEPPADLSHDAVAGNVRSIVAALLPSDARLLYAEALRDGSVSDLEAARAAGAEYLVIPAPLDWMPAHPEARLHIEASFELVTHQEHACAIYDLKSGTTPMARTPSPRTARTGRPRGARRKTDG